MTAPNGTGLRLPPIHYTRLNVTSVRTYAGGSQEIFLEGGLEAALPGQFLMMDVDPSSTVMRPYTVFRSPDSDTRTVLLRGVRPEALTPGRNVAVIGPLGSPFPHPEPGQTTFALVESGRLAALFGAIQAAAGKAPHGVHLWVSGTHRAHFDAMEWISELDVHLHRVERGDVVGVMLTAVEGGERLIAAMPEPRLAHLAARLQALGWVGPNRATGLDASGHRASPRLRSAHAAVETPMACGVGACFGCPVRLLNPPDPRHPYVRACTEGPVMDLTAVALA